MEQKQSESPVATGGRAQRLIEIFVTLGLLTYVGYFLFSIQGLRSQARMFPNAVLIVCGALLVLSLATAVWQAFRPTSEVSDAPPESTPEREQLTSVSRSLLIPVVLIAGAFAIDALGFYIALPLLAAALFWLAGCRPWWLPLALALPVTGIVWLIFDQLVGVTLPR